MRARETRNIIIRDATTADVNAICEIVRGMGDATASPITGDYARAALERRGFGILVAEEPAGVTGLLSYSIRPNLWHAADACLIEILAVLPPARGRGVGNALMTEILDRMSSRGCAEITVTVDRANIGAQRLYRNHGLTEEIVCLERHL